MYVELKKFGLDQQVNPFKFILYIQNKRGEPDPDQESSWSF